MPKPLPSKTTAVVSGIAAFLASTIWPGSVAADQTKTALCKEGVSFTHKRLADSETEDFCKTYQGKVVLIVNTASKCAFTDQYDGLEKIYAKYKDRGFVVVGFPSTDFGNQEFGTEKKIKDFCRNTYGVQFPMYAKTSVWGDNAAPIYKALISASGTTPKWNFYKYLIDRQGNVVDSYSSFTGPESPSLIKSIEKLL